MNEPVPTLSVENLAKRYRAQHGTVYALRDLSFDIPAGHSVSIVGESGCGKTTAAFCIAGLQSIDAGAVYLAGEKFSGASRGVQKRLRKDFGMVFQNPLSALNPRMRIWQSVAEPLRVHDPAVTPLTRQRQAEAMLEQVGLGKQHFQAFPGEMSGGQLQRVVLARALILDPRLVILDEPTSALDVSIQAQVLNLLQELKSTRPLSYLFITHNLALVEVLTDRVMVMYAGRVVEAGPAAEVFAHPGHPYTRELIQAIPDANPGKRQTFPSIEISPVQQAANSGCAYRLRCPHAQTDCAETVPQLGPQARAAACLHPLQ
ncbi:MAG: oligopeptide/dipeptide ABC transporter ATP-binding protein [Sterolibacterium sp.]|jgi:oligopeptide/dipeptide ABC transporter ATP-binding protein